MGFLRIILLVANAGYFALLVYVTITETHSGDEWWQTLSVYGLMTCLALNFIYLLPGNRPSNWRIFRLIGLWFDAKESELRQRADRPRQDK